MIINGNYKFIDFDNLKPDFIEGFTEYYGEGYKDIITDTINKIKYKPFHSASYIDKYYDELIYFYQDEIADEFYKKGYKKTDEIDNLIRRENPKSVAKVFFSAEGDIDLSTLPFCPDALKLIEDSRDATQKAFHLEGSDEELIESYKKIVADLEDATRIITKRHDCDIFRDIEKINQNSKDCLIEYLRSAKDSGYDVSFDDIVYVSSEGFNLKNIYNLNCYNKLMGSSVAEPGVIESFSSNSNKLLDEGKPQDVRRILTNRLKYLYSLKVPFKYIDPKEVYLNNPDDKYLEKIIIEYEHQRRHAEIPEYIDYWNYNTKEINSNFAKGQFFPTKLADELEEIRKIYANYIYHDVDFCKSIYPIYINSGLDWFTTYDFENDDPTKPYSSICFNEDQVYDERSLVEIMCHEVNHAVSHQKPFLIREDGCIEKNGLNITHRPIKNKRLDLSEGYRYNTALQKLEEDINQRQAEELSDIIYPKLAGRLYTEQDTISPEEQCRFECGYGTYYYLTDDFYYRYKEDLKTQKIDPDFDIYFDYNLPMSNMEEITNKFASYIERLLNKNKYASAGVLDYFKVNELANLLDTHNSEIRSVIQEDEDDIHVIDLRDPENLHSLEKPIYKKVIDLLRKKDKIIAKMVRDEELFEDKVEDISAEDVRKLLKKKQRENKWSNIKDILYHALVRVEPEFDELDTRLDIELPEEQKKKETRKKPSIKDVLYGILVREEPDIDLKENIDHEFGDDNKKHHKRHKDNGFDNVKFDKNTEDTKSHSTSKNNGFDKVDLPDVEGEYQSDVPKVNIIDRIKEKYGNRKKEKSGKVKEFLKKVLIREIDEEFIEEPKKPKNKPVIDEQPVFYIDDELPDKVEISNPQDNNVEESIEETSPEETKPEETKPEETKPEETVIQQPKKMKGNPKTRAFLNDVLYKGIQPGEWDNTLDL